MTEQNSEAIDLKQLEIRIDDLIGRIDSLTSENGALRRKQGDLVSERAELIEKTEMARGRIESMISRLRAMETHQ